MLYSNTLPQTTIAFLVLTMGICAQDASERLRLMPADSGPSKSFGYSVAIHGDWAIVGALGDDELGDRSGAAYIYDARTGHQTLKLLPPEPHPHDHFGWAVATNGSTAIITAPFNDDLTGDSGTVYLFDVLTGQRLARLYPDTVSWDTHFGYSAAVSGATGIVGAIGDDSADPTSIYCNSGAAYLLDMTTGVVTAKLLANDLACPDQFGRSVGISGTTAIIGAPHDGDLGTYSGSAYLFDTLTGAQTRKLLPADGAVDDRFGSAVAISGTTAVVGSPADDDHGDWSGSAYLFDTATGQQIVKLLPNDGAIGDRFGVSVAIDGSTVAIGAYGDGDLGSLSGSVYLFDAASGLQIAKVLPSDGSSNGKFGFSVALSDNVLIVGNEGYDTPAGTPYPAYVFCLNAGINYCSSNPNSTGRVATISACGSSTSSATNHFILTAKPVPDQPYLFFHGGSQVQVPFGDGYLCATGSIVRLGPPEMAVSNVATRTVDVPLEVSTLGTRHFQCWFRDPAAGGAGFSFSNGLAVSFAP